MKNSSWKVFYFIVLLLIIPKKAAAMHIMEGFFPIKWVIFWWASNDSISHSWIPFDS